MTRRSGKFYSRNEKETLKKLGLTPAPLSGAGWIQKEDGENETTLVQLKSTDNSSYRIQMQDIKELEYHAQVSHKVPIFLIQFLKQDKIYAVIDIQYLTEAYKAIEMDEAPENIVLNVKPVQVERKRVKSSSRAREELEAERVKKYGKRK